ncbi:unnamed protein product [Schistosoma rodhaini]|uniref:Uncharacterized protein n=1 Tax=Schistosoma rodhaini TaxID=6188 RepID=A0AA85FYD3_9TREM|nr:unnamed protein product [Schistosoma rodhaini]
MQLKHGSPLSESFFYSVLNHLIVFYSQLLSQMLHRTEPFRIEYTTKEYKESTGYLLANEYAMRITMNMIICSKMIHYRIRRR